MASILRSLLVPLRRSPLLEALPKPFSTLSVSLPPGWPLLRPLPVFPLHQSGFKQKVKLRKRCKDCYLVCRDERWYVICPTHPRHKQMSMIKKDKYRWIISSASQSKERPW